MSATVEAFEQVREMRVGSVIHLGAASVRKHGARRFFVTSRRGTIEPVYGIAMAAARALDVPVGRVLSDLRRAK